MSAEVIITNAGEEYFITVSGRVTFEHAAQLRNLARDLETRNFSKVSVNLDQCGGMDSTFMGILAMIGLRARKINVPVVICNASEANKALLFGLGLKKLFDFQDGVTFASGKDWTSSEDVSSNRAETVLEAHKTLMSADEQNVKKFEKVVEFVQKDIDKLNQEKK